MLFKVGDLVRIIVDRPDGCDEQIHTKDKINIITKIENGNYIMNDEYVYGINQIKPVTDKEAREELIRILNKRGNK